MQESIALMDWIPIHRSLDAAGPGAVQMGLVNQVQAQAESHLREHFAIRYPDAWIEAHLQQHQV